MINLEEFVLEGRSNGQPDKHAVRELIIYADNNKKCYDDLLQISKTLEKKIKKGIELDFEYLAKSSFIDSFVRNTYKSYCKSYGGFHLDTPTRNMAKHYVAALLFHMLDDNGYELKDFENNPYYDLRQIDKVEV